MLWQVRSSVQRQCAGFNQRSYSIRIIVSRMVSARIGHIFGRGICKGEAGGLGPHNGCMIVHNNY